MRAMPLYLRTRHFRRLLGKAGATHAKHIESVPEMMKESILEAEDSGALKCTSKTPVEESQRCAVGYSPTDEASR